MAQQVVALTGDEQQLIKSLDKVIAKQLEYERKLRDSEDAGREAGAAVGGAFDKAGRDAQRQMKDVLKELRALGPEGREAAEQLKRELVAAGELAERSMEDIVAELEKVSPAAAAAGRKIEAAMSKAGDKGKQAFSQFRMAAVAQVSQIATSLGGVENIVANITAGLEKQKQLREDARNAQASLGEVQLGALKNLAALPEPDVKKLLTEDTKKIAERTGLSDLKALTLTFSNLGSAGVTSRTEAKEAAEAAAPLYLLTPDSLPDATTAAFQVSQAGNIPIESALALNAAAGSVALPSSEKLAPLIPRVVQAVANAMPEMDPVEAAEQGLALYGVSTQIAKDFEGKTSVTFNSQFHRRFDDFFDQFESVKMEARDELRKLEGKVERGTAGEVDRAKLKETKQFLEEAKGVVDPDELKDRIRVFHANPAVGKRFVGDGFGEDAHQPFLNQIIDPDSAASKMFFETLESGVVSADRETYLANVRKAKSLTPELVAGTAEAKSDSGKVLRDLADTEGALLSRIRKTVSEGIEGTRLGWFDWSGPYWVEDGGLVGTTPAQEAIDGIGVLQRRRKWLAGNRDVDSLPPSRQAKIFDLTAKEESLRTLLVDSVRTGVLSLDELKAERDAAATGVLQDHRDQTVKLLESLIEEVRGLRNDQIEGPLIEEVRGLRDEQAEGQTPPQVNVTPELSANVP
ncbi:MAG: hypothetical protein AAF394_08960 [Planctomycetota bacterium]